MLSKTFTCIICPNGCSIETKSENGIVVSIEGNRCKRGEAYVRQELTDPRRTISSTVPISGSMLPLCSVRLTKPIAKRDIFRVMAQINRQKLTAPAHIGQVVIKNVCGLDSDVIVTKEMPESEFNLK